MDSGAPRPPLALSTAARLRFQFQAAAHAAMMPTPMPLAPMRMAKPLAAPIAATSIDAPSTIRPAAQMASQAASMARQGSIPRRERARVMIIKAMAQPHQAARRHGESSRA